MLYFVYCNCYAEDTLWTGTPGDYTDPNAPAALSEVRKLVDGGQYAEATKAAVKLTDNPSDVCFFASCSTIEVLSSVVLIHFSTFL